MAATTFSVDADFTRVAMLSHTKFVVVYRENPVLEARARVGSVSGGAVSFGAYAAMDPSSVLGSLNDPFAVVAIDSGRALALWSGNLGGGAWAAVLTVTGDAVTAGPRNQFAGAGGAGNDIEELDAVPLGGGRALVTFRRRDPVGPVWDANALVATVAGADVTFGSTYVFYAGHATSIFAAALGPDRAVIAYNDAVYMGKALIATVAGTAVAFGAPALFQIGEVEANLSLTALGGDGRRFVLTYKNGRGYAKVGTVTGTSIALGPPREFYSGTDLLGTRVKLLGPDQAVLLSRIGVPSSNTLVDRLMTISGDAIAFGSPGTCVPDTVDYLDLGAEEDGTVVVVYARRTPDDVGRAVQLEQYESAVTLPPSRGKFSDDADYCAVARLSSTKFVVAFRENPSGYATAKVGTLSGTDITFGPPVVLDVDGLADSFAVVGLDSTHAVVAWGSNSSTPPRAAVLTVVGGTSATVGAAVALSSPHADSMNALYLGPGRVLIVFRGYTAGSVVKARLATVSGTDITLGDSAEFGAAIRTGLRAVQLSSTKAAVAFTDSPTASKAMIAAVAADGAVTFGTPNTFQTGEETPLISLMKLDEHGENFAAAYVHGKGYIRIGTVSGTGMGVTFGEETEFYALTSLRGLSVARLDAGHGALILREDPANNSRDKLATFDAPIAFASSIWFTGGSSPLSLASAALDGENAIVVYRDSLSGDGTAVLRQYSYAPPTTTTTEPPGTPTIVGSNLSLCRAAKLSSTAFVVVYQDPGHNHKPFAAVGRLDGTDVEFGTPKAMDTQWAGTGTDTFAVVRLDSTRALAVWRRYQPADDQILACVLTKRGTLQVDAGPPVVMFTGAGGNSLQYLEPVFLSAGKVLIAFSNQVSSNRPSAVVATVSGNSVTFGAFHELIGPDTTLGLSAAAISATKAVVAFIDSASGNDGKAVVATVSGTDVTFGPPRRFPDRFPERRLYLGPEAGRDFVRQQVRGRVQGRGGAALRRVEQGRRQGRHRVRIEHRLRRATDVRRAIGRPVWHPPVPPRRRPGLAARRCQGVLRLPRRVGREGHAGDRR